MADYKDAAPEEDDDLEPEEEGAEISGEEVEEDEDAPFPAYEDDDPNLALTFEKHKKGEAVLKELGEEVFEKFKSAYDGSDEYREKMTANWEIFSGNLPPKTFPYADCANGNVPIMIENITRLHARAFSELFGDWSNICGAQPLGPAAEGEAQLVALHSNWQFREQITDFKRQMDRGLLMFFVVGDETYHSYFDDEKKVNRHEVMTPDEFAVPFTYVSTQPDYSDCPFYAKIFNVYRHTLQAKKELWAKVDEIIDDEPTFDDEPEQKMADKAAEVQGVAKGDYAPYKLIWFEGWLELPLQAKDRWCRVILDVKSHTILELMIHEEANWQDVERYKTQQAELENYRLEMQNYQALIQQNDQQVAEVAQTALAIKDQMGPEQTQLVADQLTEAQAMKPQAPLAPTWLKNPDDPEAEAQAPRYQPIRLFTHIVCIEPLVGTLGLGFGRIQGDLNRAANTMFNQYIDGATMSNVWCLIVSNQVQFSEKLVFRPGAIIKVEGMSGSEIKENIMELKPSPPSAELVQGVSMLAQWGSSSMQAPGVLSGESGKSGESAKLQMSRVEQATKQLSVYTRKFADGLEWVMRANAALNRIFMPDEEIIAVAREHGAPLDPTVKIDRHLYDRSYRFMVTADLRFTGKTQKIQEADELFMLVKQSPTLAQNNKFMYEIVKKALIAREEYGLIPALGRDPGVPMGPDGQPAPFGTPPAAPTQPPGQQGATPPQPQQGQGGGQPQGNTPQQGPPRPPAAPQAQPPQPMPQGNR